jgi:hypothetical protein
MGSLMLLWKSAVSLDSLDESTGVLINPLAEQDRPRARRVQAKQEDR